MLIEVQYLPTHVSVTVATQSQNLVETGNPVENDGKATITRAFASVISHIIMGNNPFLQ